MNQHCSVTKWGSWSIKFNMNFEKKNFSFGVDTFTDWLRKIKTRVTEKLSTVNNFGTKKWSNSNSFLLHNLWRLVTRERKWYDFCNVSRCLKWISNAQSQAPNFFYFMKLFNYPCLMHDFYFIISIKLWFIVLNM